MPDLQVLIRRWQAGDERAAQAIYERFWDSSFSLAYTLLDDRAHTGEQLRLLEGHSEGVWSAAFSPDGRTIVTASPDLTARVWMARIEDLLDLSERLVQREPPILTPKERARFLGELPTLARPDGVDQASSP